MMIILVHNDVAPVAVKERCSLSLNRCRCNDCTWSVDKSFEFDRSDQRKQVHRFCGFNLNTCIGLRVYNHAYILIRTVLYTCAHISVISIRLFDASPKVRSESIH